MLKTVLFIFITLLSCCFFQTDTLKIVSLNIRFENNTDGVNNWDNRKRLVTLFFNSEKPDIICLQEVLEPQLKYLQESLPRYKSVGVYPWDGQSMPVILFDTLKIKLLETGCFWLSETPEKKGSIGWDAKFPRVVTWAKIENIKKQTIYVLNTHLDHKGKIARIESAKLIINWIKKNTLGHAVILSGDFNISQNSEAYHIIVDSNELVDSYKIASLIKGVKYTFHKFGKKPIEQRNKIDYIFVSKNYFNVFEVNIPKEDVQFMLSDHNPVIVNLQLVHK